jgi:tRNA G37 N-methylase Trm5
VTSVFAAKSGHVVIAVEGNRSTAQVFKFNTLLNCVQDKVTLVESIISNRQEIVSFK